MLAILVVLGAVPCWAHHFVRVFPLLQFVGAYCCPPVRVLVMEYCRGGSVRHWLRLRRGQLIPPLHLLDMAADIAHAGA